MRLIIIYSLLCFFWSLSLRSQSCIQENQYHYNFVDVAAILDKNNCNNCHYQNSSLWNYSDYYSLMQLNKCDNEMVIHGNAGQSQLVKILNQSTLCNYSYHQNNHTLLDDDIEKIEAWINYGAPEKCIPKESEIRQILINNTCNGCHNGDAVAGNFNIQDLSKSKPSSLDCGTDKHIHLYKPKLSSLYQIAAGNNDCINNSPYHLPLESEEIIKIRDWIAAGAPLSYESLPLDLLDFYIYVESNAPKLIWKTSSEVGIHKFIIERSDVYSDFVKIGEIQAKGGNNITQYEYLDQTTQAGNYYYRIKIVEFDERHEYSPVEFVRLSSNNFVFKSFPNPTYGGQHLIIEWFSKNDIQKTAKMDLTDSSGKVLKQFNIHDGTNKLNLPLLSNGIYYLTVVDYYGGTHFERLIVIN